MVTAYYSEPGSLFVPSKWLVLMGQRRGEAAWSAGWPQIALTLFRRASQFIAGQERRRGENHKETGVSWH